MLTTATSSSACVAVPFKAPPSCRSRRTALCCLATYRPNEQQPCWAERLAHGATAILATGLLASAATAGTLTFDQIQGMTYKEVKGSGLANQCPILGDGAETDLKNWAPGTYKMDMFCMEPSTFKVKAVGQKEFEPSTLLTRNTYSLDQMTGSVNVARDGAVEIQEEDGFDFQPVTVKLRGGEEVPFMFAVKNLNAKGPWNGFTGQFDVNSYRGSSFMDPLGRGGSTGWNYQKGLQAAGSQDELDRENFKRADPTKGQALFAISRTDPATGEVAGVFVTRQLGSDDMGSKDPPEVQVEGNWYAQLSS